MDHKPRPHSCCDIEENLKHYMERPELAVEECKVCGRKHRRLVVETAIFKTIQEQEDGRETDLRKSVS